jgi:hypothetical protein
MNGKRLNHDDTTGTTNGNSFATDYTDGYGSTSNG